MANLYDELKATWDELERMPEAVEKRYLDEQGLVLVVGYQDVYTNPQNFKDKDAMTYIFADVDNLVICQCVDGVIQMEWSVGRNMLNVAEKRQDELLAKIKEA